MTPLVPATVLFGDVVDSRADPGASAFLRALRDELEAAYGTRRLAPAGFTQGDELQLLLAPAADPFTAVLRAALHPGRPRAALGRRRRGGARRDRARDRADGPGVRRARELLERAKARREGLLAVTGDAAADALLLDLGPLLAALLAELTDRQREVARLLLIEGLRRAEAAERLGVSRATVSVIAARGRVRHLASLASALARTFGEGVERASRAVAPGRPSRQARHDGRRPRPRVAGARPPDRRLRPPERLDRHQQGDRRSGVGWAALSVHGFHVAITLLPVVFAWGARGFAVRRGRRPHPHGGRPLEGPRDPPVGALRARGRGATACGPPETTPSGLGVAWTPWPGMLFMADQVLHLTIAIVGWLVILQGIALSSLFVDAVNRVLSPAWDRATVHAVVLTGVVMVSLFLVNTRAAYYFILALVSPREIPETEKPPRAQPRRPSRRTRGPG